MRTLRVTLPVPVSLPPLLPLSSIGAARGAVQHLFKGAPRRYGHSLEEHSERHRGGTRLDCAA
eukprot:scaffold198735_cov17-Tisochrysis_lutea.AAC.1